MSSTPCFVTNLNAAFNILLCNPHRVSLFNHGGIPIRGFYKCFTVKPIDAFKINIIFIFKIPVLIFRSKPNLIKGLAIYNKYHIKLRISDISSTGFTQ